jgi:hypothetical protein
VVTSTLSFPREEGTDLRVSAGVRVHVCLLQAKALCAPCVLRGDSLTSSDTQGVRGSAKCPLAMCLPTIPSKPGGPPGLSLLFRSLSRHVGTASPTGSSVFAENVRGLRVQMSPALKVTSNISARPRWAQQNP